MNCSGPEFVSIHAPYGRDSALIAEALKQGGIAAGAAETMDALCKDVESGIGAALISDQALTQSNVRQLADTIAQQPPWSDFPLIVTTSGGEETSASKQRLALLDPLGNVALLERPLKKVTLVSAVRTALRARRRQYQLQDNFIEREHLVRELKRSNEELAEFPHVVSHDLQAPIRMIRCFADLLARNSLQQLDEAGSRYLSTIQKGAVQMDDLVNSLLRYATVGQDSISLREVSLTGIVEAVCLLLRPNIEEAGASVSCGPLPNVWGDATQLQRVVQNLVSNALKYRKPGSALAVSITSESTGRFFKVLVADNGPGIDRQYHDRIFQPLKRLHGADIAGTGMGLAVCRKIIERHGGQIWVESEPGKGARFIFTVPAQTEGHNPSLAANDAEDESDTLMSQASSATQA